MSEPRMGWSDLPKLATENRGYPYLITGTVPRLNVQF